MQVTSPNFEPICKKSEHAYVNGAIQGNVAMHVTYLGINASGAIWWPNLQPMHVAPSGGQIWN